MRTVCSALLASALLGSLACGRDQQVDYFQDVPRADDFPGTPADSAAYAELFSYTPDPKCVPAVPRVLARKTELRVFRGNGITLEDTRRFMSGLKRYYDHYGVTLYTRHDVLQVPMDHAVVFNEEAIMDWMLEHSSENPSCLADVYPTPACQRAMGAAMFYNVKQFLHAYAEPEDNVINVVLLKRVASLEPSRSMALDNWSVAGLGLSETLIHSVAGSDLGMSLATVLDETDFSPTIFIGANLVDFVLSAPDVVIAHELGHAYGLEHVDPSDYSSNLMLPTATKCTLSLSASQLTTIEAATARYGNVLDVGHFRGSELLSFVHRGDEIMRIVGARVASLSQARGALQ